MVPFRCQSGAMFRTRLFLSLDFVGSPSGPLPTCVYELDIAVILAAFHMSEAIKVESWRGAQVQPG